jgi:hypothetical protein
MSRPPPQAAMRFTGSRFDLEGTNRGSSRRTLKMATLDAGRAARETPTSPILQRFMLIHGADFEGCARNSGNASVPSARRDRQVLD